MEDGGMEKPVKRKSNGMKGRDGALDLDTLLHPARAFGHPADVVNDPDLTLSEKRAILASWASDACAAEAVPVLHQEPGLRPVRFDDIMDALRSIDRQAPYRPRPHYRQVLEQRIPGVFGRKSSDSDDHDQPLN
jgi:hypothetical protein